jgi:putative SOS response-associated peptidase YedK
LSGEVREAGARCERLIAVEDTVAANELVATIHDRMPAIIPIEHHQRWLGPELDPRDLLKPFPADRLKIFRRG